MSRFDDFEQQAMVKSARSVQLDRRPPLAAVHEAFNMADDLASAVHQFLDTLFGPETAQDGESVYPALEGVIPRLDDRADGVCRRVGRALDRINVANKEIGL